MRLTRALLLLALSSALASLVAYVVAIRPRLREWGADPVEASMPIPGDELVPEASATETRGITIDAPVAKVWPWLVQMGHRRAGWYSYDVLDDRRPSADEILPEFQTLNSGDTVPMNQNSGFRVEVIEPERALVLYMDGAVIREQADRAEAAGDTMTEPDRKRADAMRAASSSDFATSWAFFLQPIDEGKTRLVERFRVRTPGSRPANAVVRDIMGTGIVLMTRKQMIGIKERVERAEQWEAEPAAVGA